MTPASRRRTCLRGQPLPVQACACRQMLNACSCRTSLPPPDPLDEDLQRADRLSAASLTNGRISPQLLLSCGLPGAWGLPLMQPDTSRCADWAMLGWPQNAGHLQACWQHSACLHIFLTAMGLKILADQAVQLHSSVTLRPKKLQAWGKGRCALVKNQLQDAAGLAIASTPSCPCAQPCHGCNNDACLLDSRHHTRLMTDT